MTTNAIGRRELIAAGAALSVAAAGATPAQAQVKSRLSTHVLDTYHGIPGEGVTIEFYKRDGDNYALQKTVVTNHDGRAGKPLLPAEGPASLGQYRLVFHVADYFQRWERRCPTHRSSIGSRSTSPFTRRRSTIMCLSSAPPGATPPTVAAEGGAWEFAGAQLAPSAGRVKKRQSIADRT